MVNSAQKVANKAKAQRILGDQMDLLVRNVGWLSDGSDFCTRIAHILRRSQKLRLIENTADTNIVAFIIDKTPRNHKFKPTAKKIVIGRHDNFDILRRAIVMCGANSYIPFDISANGGQDAFLAQFERDVEQIEHGSEPIFEQVKRLPQAKSEQLIDTILDRKNINANDCDLNARELEMLSFVANGLTDKEISEQQSYGVQTVKNRLCEIRRKIKAKSRTHAVVIAMRNEWIS